VAVLAPALRDRYDLTLSQVGIALAAPFLGSTLALLAWGLLTDRIGERPVLAVGLLGAAAATGGAAVFDGFVLLVALLVVAGASGASVNSASGRAVMHWFEASERGLALGLRQTAIPIGGAVAALVLPQLSLTAAFLALAGALALTGLVAAALIKDRAADPAPAATEPAGAVLRDARIWRLSSGSAFLLAPQICLVGFIVLLLHDRRGFSAGAAAAVLAVVQVLGIGARIGAGRWSDVAGSRLLPLRRIALAMAVAVALVAVLVPAPRALLLPPLVVAGVLAMSWNGLSFTAAAELAGPARSGAALGLQQTVLALAAAALPAPFAALVDATSWSLAIAVVALFPLVGWRLLEPLSG